MVNSSSTHDGDDFGIYHQKYTIAGALPVELLTFTGRKVTEETLLEWQTATEINNDYFDIEWSTDGLEFSKIGQVKGTGTTDEVQSYDFLHTTPANGINYYRLKQVDFDRIYEYSDVLNIKYRISPEPNSGQVKIQYLIYPNPTSNQITIKTTEEMNTVAMIYNQSGQLVKQFTIQANRTQQDISELAGGSYVLKIGNLTKQLVIVK